LLLAIESSCDETAAAVIDRQLVIRSNVVASQIDLHAEFGGVVPEIASRAHLRNILPVLEQALDSARVTLEQITAVAVVTEPGLVGSLLVGLTAAKAICLAHNLPLIPVHHIEAHLYACRMSAGCDVYPAVGLVVSGGHTSLYDCQGPLESHLIGSTIDDAAGEAFDKVAQLLELGYPGGPPIEQAARNGQPDRIQLPRPMLNLPGLDFSFSGLKTAVRYQVHGVPGTDRTPPEMTPERTADLAASFQDAVIDCLVARSQRALEQLGHQALLVGGGVAANGALRDALDRMCHEQHVRLHIAPPELCTDNAAMAALGWERLDAGHTAQLDVDVTPGLLRRR
jgi:N6-L-threonylcarbamoyladenine synthase